MYCELSINNRSITSAISESCLAVQARNAILTRVYHPEILGGGIKWRHSVQYFSMGGGEVNSLGCPPPLSGKP